MAERIAHHRTRDDEQKCDVSGCKEPAERSLPKRSAAAVIPDVRSDMDRVHVCRKHYREFKKKTRKDRDIERLGW